MAFRKIWPWLVGIIVLILIVAGAFFARFWFFGGRLAAPMMQRFQQGGFQRGFGAGPGFRGPMMGGWGGHMGGGFGMFGGLGMILGPLFLVALLLFTVWAVMRIVRSSSPHGVPLTARACPNCGRGVAADWNTCPYCGTDLNHPAAPPPPGPNA